MPDPVSICTQDSFAQPPARRKLSLNLMERLAVSSFAKRDDGLENFAANLSDVDVVFAPTKEHSAAIPGRLKTRKALLQQGQRTGNDTLRFANGTPADRHEEELRRWR